MRLFLIAGIAAAALLGAHGLAAQELSIEEALGLCMKMPDPGDRLQCFEALARAAAPKQSARAESSRPAQKPAAATPASPASTANAAPAGKSAQAGQSGTTAGIQVKTKKKRGGIFPFNRLKKSKQKYVFVKPGETPPNRVGRTLKKPKRVAYGAKVLKAWHNGIGKLYIALDNGEVWKQADPDKPRTPKPGTVVRLKPGFAGSWFMSFSNHNPRIRVKLIKASPE